MNLIYKTIFSYSYFFVLRFQIETYTSSPKPLQSTVNTPHLLSTVATQPKRICTVEELEKNLLKSAKPAVSTTITQSQLQSQPHTQPPQQHPHTQQHPQPHHSPQQNPLPRPLVPPPGVHLPGHNFHPLLQVNVNTNTFLV